jgi:pimeloyl-ACP methyl ester carboxylesterase
MGESLGSAVVTELATEHPPAGLVLRSPFTDLAAAGQHHYPMLPVRLMLRERLPVAELLERVHVPTVVVYGTADAVIPSEQSRQVAARAPRLIDLVVVEGADHNDPTLVLGAPFIDAVVSLADHLDGGREPR